MGLIETISGVNCWIRGSKKQYIHTWQVRNTSHQSTAGPPRHLQALLQSKLTVVLLTSLSVLTAAKQYLGDPIHCIFDTRCSLTLENSVVLF